MNNILVRTATNKDLDKIVDVNLLSLKTEINNGLIQKRTKEEFEKLLNICKYFIVAESGDSIIGYVIVLDESAEFLNNEIFSFYPRHYKEFVFIDQVAVKPAYRRMGIARKMYRFFLFQEKKKILVDILVTPPNEMSIKFHKSLGFKSTGNFINLKSGLRVEVYEYMV